MSAVQTRIPFKCRKKRFASGKQCEINNENIENEIKNSNVSTKPSTINKHKIIKEDKNRSTRDEESCSSQKKHKSDKKMTISKIEPDQKLSIKETPRPLPSRETEIKELVTFLEEHLDNEISGSMYISGQPGTGKTASLNYVLQLTQFKENYKQVYINCTTMKSAASIYNRICKELQISTSSASEKTCLSAIEKYLANKHRMIVIVLDEIDQLDRGRGRQSVLYTVFGWSATRQYRVVLVGVANALDLTDRVLPRLRARHDLRPHTLHFAPYTKAQILHIFTTILAQQDNTGVFSPVALQMLAAKISAISGDMRRALDIGRRVIEVAKRNRCKDNGSSVDTTSMIQDETVTVELKEVLQVLDDVYGGSGNIDVAQHELPMQQKLILCTIMLMLNKGNKNEILLGKLYDVYKRVATSRNTGCLEMSELVSACGLLSERGAVRVAGGGGARARRLSLLWERDTLLNALNDQPLLSHVLNHSNALLH